MAELSSWLNTVSAELGITDVELDNNDIHTLLDLARDSAHEVERLAAPLTVVPGGRGGGPRGLPRLRGGEGHRVGPHQRLRDPPSDAALTPTGGTPDESA